MNISPVNFANINFSARKNEYTVPYGIDYSSIDEYHRSDFSKSEIALASQEGKLTQEMIEEMIMNRIPKTLSHAQKFVLEHPEFEEDDIAQQLILLVVQLANKYKGEAKGNFNTHAYNSERAMLDNLAKQKAKETDWQAQDVNIKNIKDNQVDLLMREQLSKDVQTAVSTLDTWEEDIIRKHYGLNGMEGKELSVCADEFDTTVDFVEQVERQAIRHLCHPHRMYDILEDINYMYNGDDEDKLALILDRNNTSV